MSKFTTIPPPFDITAKYPELIRLQQTGVRLHPRKHSGLPLHSSKIGGVFYANSPNEWPFCEEHDSHYIGVIQLTKDDVPELGFPGDSDCFQMLMCPFDHEDAFCPAVAGRWLKFGHAPQESQNPAFREPEYSYTPTECGIHPERVIEYPDFDELPESLANRIQEDASLVAPVREWLDEPDSESASRTAYQWFLSGADGTKVRGYPRWVQFPAYPRCPKCHHPTEYLLTLASWEWDGGTYHRWKPDPLRRDDARLADGGDDHGMMLGDAGDIYLGVCRRCAGWPVAGSSQCS
jgi:hypothetical protein